MNEVKKYLKRIGKKGGKSNVAKNGKKHMAEIGKLGGKNRWAKLDKKDIHTDNV